MNKVDQDLLVARQMMEEEIGEDDALLTIVMPTAQNEDLIQSSTKKSRRRVHKQARWSKQENDVLIQLKNQNQKTSWPKISRMLADICGTEPKKPGSVSQHYYRTLINDKRNWTQDEDNLIKKFYAEYGNKWASIGRHLPGRSDLQVKYRVSILKQGGFL